MSLDDHVARAKQELQRLLKRAVEGYGPQPKPEAFVAEEFTVDWTINASFLPSAVRETLAASSTTSATTSVTGTLTRGTMTTSTSRAPKPMPAKVREILTKYAALSDDEVKRTIALFEKRASDLSKDQAAERLRFLDIMVAFADAATKDAEVRSFISGVDSTATPAFGTSLMTLGSEVDTFLVNVLKMMQKEAMEATGSVNVPTWTPSGGGGTTTSGPKLLLGMTTETANMALYGLLGVVGLLLMILLISFAR